MDLVSPMRPLNRAFASFALPALLLTLTPLSCCFSIVMANSDTMTESSDSERFSEGWDEHARKAFLLMDPKDDKYIQGCQLEFYFQAIGENPTRAEIRAAMAAIGKSEEQPFAFEDCVAALKSFVSATVGSKSHIPPEDIVRVVTQSLDPTGTGAFARDALLKLLSGDGSADASKELLSKEEVEQILSELKTTDGNMIQAADFFSLLLDI